MDETYRPFFFYGTSQPDSRGFGSTIAKSVTEHAPAHLADATLYIGPSYPLGIHERGGTGITGTICLLEERLFDQLLADIDDQEGYNGEGRSDNLYVREVAWVDVDPCDTWTGECRVRAYVYMASDETMEDEGAEFVRSPSGDWHNHSDEWEDTAEEREAEEAAEEAAEAEAEAADDEDEDDR